MRRLWEHMPISRRHVVAGLATILLWPCIWAQAGAGTAEAPDVFLAELTDRAVAQLTEPGLAQQEQEGRFRSLLNEGFDLPEIGRFVLGRYWRRASETERNEFLAAFEDMMLHRFLPMFSEYSGEKIDIGTIRPFSNNPDFVSVTSQLLRSEGEPIHVDWRLRKRGQGYKIVDVVAEGVSIAVTLRSEYLSVLKQKGGSVAALTRVLRAKVSGL